MAVTFIKPNEINSKKIKDILDKYLIENELDDDGDVVIDEPLRMYIQINEREKVIRIFRFSYLFGLFDDISLETNDVEIPFDLRFKILDEVNELNTASNFAKHILFKKSILSETSVIIDSSINEEGFVRHFKKFQSEIIKLSNTTPFKEWL